MPIQTLSLRELDHKRICALASLSTGEQFLETLPPQAFIGL
jgi:hypothetical protein